MTSVWFYTSTQSVIPGTPEANHSDVSNSSDPAVPRGSWPYLDEAGTLGLVYSPTGLGLVTLAVVLLVYWRKFLSLERAGWKKHPPPIPGKMA